MGKLVGSSQGAGLLVQARRVALAEEREGRWAGRCILLRDAYNVLPSRNVASSFYIPIWRVERRP